MQQRSAAQCFVFLFILFCSVSASGACIDYDFQCCTVVDYPVYWVLADTLDTSTCRTINIILKQNSNWTKSCQNAFIESFCLISVPECCSADDPVIYTTCSSVCSNLLTTCSGSGTNTTSCDDPPFYSPPCNSGNGGPCPNSPNHNFRQHLGSLDLTEIQSEEKLERELFSIGHTVANQMNQ